MSIWETHLAAENSFVMLKEGFKTVFQSLYGAKKGIIGQVAQWLAGEADAELPAGYESPTQIARTEFGKAVIADESLQQLLRSAVARKMDLSALNRAVGQIAGLDEVEAYQELRDLGEDAAAFVARDILRYLEMKLA